MAAAAAVAEAEADADEKKKRAVPAWLVLGLLVVLVLWPEEPRAEAGDEVEAANLWWPRCAVVLMSKRPWSGGGIAAKTCQR